MAKTSSNIATIITLGIITILLAILITVLFKLNLVQTLIMGWALTMLYAILVITLVMNMAKSTRKTKIREVTKEVEKPVYIEKPVVKTVYAEKPRKKLDIPRYNYVASTETKTYHTRNCRLGKLIKNKFKVHNNSQAFFKDKHYKACKVCIKKK